MNNALRDAALENNVAWCDTVVRAHGLETQRNAHFWVHHGPSVPFYPRLITRASSLGEQRVEAALAPFGAGEITIKDSRADLNLDRRTFTVLFESRWIALRAGAPLNGDERLVGEWNPASSNREFQEWCSQWARFSQQDEEFARDLFKPALLEDPQVRFLMRRSKGRVVGIAITYEDGESVGISNVMGEDAARDSHWRSLALSLQLHHAPRPLVGYENGSELESAQRAGFEDVGGLRVWIKNEAPDNELTGPRL